MNKRSDILKKILLGMTFFIMFIHIIYNDFNFIKIPPLKGYVYVPEKPQLNDSTWFSGEYQLKQEDYMNSNFGFRSLYVRFNNQMDFCLFLYLVHMRQTMPILFRQNIYSMRLVVAFFQLWHRKANRHA